MRFMIITIAMFPQLTIIGAIIATIAIAIDIKKRKEKEK